MPAPADMPINDLTKELKEQDFVESIERMPSISEDEIDDVPRSRQNRRRVIVKEEPREIEEPTLASIS